MHDLERFLLVWGAQAASLQCSAACRAQMKQAATENIVSMLVGRLAALP
jgi:hypothetical protein